MRILAIGEVGDETGGGRPREHCTYIYILFSFDIAISAYLIGRYCKIAQVI
jgi:hypothetical protein